MRQITRRHISFCRPCGACVTGLCLPGAHAPGYSLPPLRGWGTDESASFVSACICCCSPSRRRFCFRLCGCCLPAPKPTKKSPRGSGCQRCRPIASRRRTRWTMHPESRYRHRSCCLDCRSDPSTPAFSTSLPSGRRSRELRRRRIWCPRRAGELRRSIDHSVSHLSSARNSTSPATPPTCTNSFCRSRPTTVGIASMPN